MNITGHTILIYFFSIYSIVFLSRTKTRNEFLLIFMVFLAFLQLGPFPNKISTIITSPINIRPMDFGLILLLFFTVKQKFRKRQFVSLAYRNTLLSLFIVIVSFYTIGGVLKHGYNGIAEFRSIFYYVIILLFISTNIKYDEIIPLIKTISIYLIPLILLVPLKLILSGNFELSASNRPLGALDYEAITLGFLAGLLINQYYDRTFKLPFKLLPIYIISFPFCNIRTVWAIIFITFPIVLIWTRRNRSTLFLLILGIGSAIFLQIDPVFLSKRFTAFTDIGSDLTGSWRLMIWKTIWQDATIFGKGLGARYYVEAPGLLPEHYTVGAHNGYFQALYYLGFLGLTIMITLICYFIFFSYKNIKLKRNNMRHQLIFRLGFLSSISLSFYMFGYGPDYLSWIFIGFALKWHYYNKGNLKYGSTKIAKNFHCHSSLQ